MKKEMLILAACIMFLTGCSAQAEKGADSSFSSEGQSGSSPAEDGAMVFLGELAEDTVTPDEKDYKELKKKYPEWFGKDGKIVYPVLPGSDEWKEASGDRGTNTSCQIPEEIVNAVDTKTLLDAVEEYPLLYAYAHNDSYAAGLQYLAETFYGMNVLLRREDAYRVAADSYLSRQLGTSDESSDDSGMLERLLLEEFLFSREYAYQKFSEEERQKILEAVEKNHDKELQLADGWLRYHFYDMAAYGDNPWQEELP